MEKMKKVLPLVIALLCTIVFTSCGMLTKDERSAYDKIQTTLLSMQSYESVASVTYISNKTNHTYETKQQCRITGEYRIEVIGPEKVAGNVTVSDGSVICQFNPKIGGKISIGSSEAMERSELFLTSFIKNYVKSNEVSVSAANIEDSTCTVLEANIPGEHPYLRSEKLWVDNNTLKPVKLVLYDPDGGERIVVSYKNFEYNVSLADNLFTIE